jgi:hypothetical protein
MMATSDPTGIFQNISLFTMACAERSAWNAASRASIDISLFFSVFHSHCVYALCTDATRLVETRNANVVPALDRIVRMPQFSIS